VGAAIVRVGRVCSVLCRPCIDCHGNDVFRLLGWFSGKAAAAEHGTTTIDTAGLLLLDVLRTIRYSWTTVPRYHTVFMHCDHFKGLVGGEADYLFVFLIFSIPADIALGIYFCCYTYRRYSDRHRMMEFIFVGSDSQYVCCGPCCGLLGVLWLICLVILALANNCTFASPDVCWSHARVPYRDTQQSYLPNCKVRHAGWTCVDDPHNNVNNRDNYCSCARYGYANDYYHNGDDAQQAPSGYVIDQTSGTCKGPTELCDNQPCGVHGVNCAATGGSYTCTCATGWAGAQCDACASGWSGARCDNATGLLLVTAPCTGPHEQIQRLGGGQRKVCSCEPGFKLTMDALAIEQAGEPADYYHTHNLMCEYGDGAHLLVSPWLIIVFSISISLVFGLCTCKCTQDGRGSRDTDLFIIIELLDAFMDVGTFAWAETGNDFGFDNDPLRLMMWSLGISVGFSVVTFIVEVGARITCKSQLRTALPILLGLHIVFEDGFQMLCYGGIVASHSERAADSVKAAMLQSFAFFIIKLFEASRKEQTGTDDRPQTGTDDRPNPHPTPRPQPIQVDATSNPVGGANRFRTTGTEPPGSPPASSYYPGINTHMDY
jgi:hypothetical protein